MKIENVVKILKVLYLMSQMPMVGQSTTRPTIIHYSGVPDSTVHRYLDKMLKLGLVHVVYIENRNNQQVGYWTITDKGLGYIMDIKELF